MISISLADAITPVLGLVLGFALARANSCTVASTRRLVVDGRFDWLFGLLIATSWSAVVLLSLSALWPGSFRLPGTIPLGWGLIGGGVMIGTGALLNRACFLGSVSLLGRGDLNYLWTLAGIAFAMALTTSALVQPPVAARWANMNALQIAALGVFGLIAIYSIWMLHKRRRTVVMALIAVGLFGGLIFAFNPDWSYASVIDRAVSGNRSSDAWVHEAGGIAVFAGASISAVLRHRFAIIAMSVQASLRNALGGFLMGLGARLIPGGNDTLMLWSIPGLTAYGIIAYVTIIATIALLLVAQRAVSRHFFRSTSA